MRARVRVPRARGWMRAAATAAGAAGLALVVGLVAPRPSFAEEPWERPIREAIADQDRELARTSPKALVNRYSGRLSRDPNDLTTLYLLARAYGKAKDVQNAVVTYGDVLKLEPRLWYAWRDRAALRYEQKDAKGAETDLRQAIALKPDFTTALQDLATLRMEAKGFEEAADLLRRVLDQEPANEKARFQLVNAYIALRRPDEGLAALQPMLAREPNNPGLRLKRAELWSAKGRHEEALAELRAIARENPSSIEPLQAWLAAARAAKTVPVDDVIWTLERLARLVREEARRKDILDQVARIRAEQAKQRQPAAPAGPPTQEQIADALRDPDEKVRRDILTWLLDWRPGMEITPPLATALVERSFQAEPVAALRAMSLAVLAKTRPVHLAPVLRWALFDADARVRAKAADVLAELRAPASVAALHPLALGDPGIADAGDREMVAIAAREAIYHIAQSRPPVAEGADAGLEPFLAWWRDVAVRPVKLAAIKDALASPDRAPWDLLQPFFADEDPAVWTTTYYAMKRVVEKAKGPSPREAWLREMPAYDAAVLVPERREAFVEGMKAWWAKKPPV